MEYFNLPDLNKEKTITKSVRISIELLERIEELSIKTNISDNRIIVECIKFALDRLNENSIKKIEKK